ncbi:Rho GTPase-activating 21 [Brachionus plicatilis]|uniref:Rho GTPase-activating 21 n=1 Tax=Brachionus plicatilis TaxID=10195 RepID=A0A3M7P4E3_BRAPC|nr:Rho GTPase-activating 21 [Brachionus plicatilis]
MFEIKSSDGYPVSSSSNNSFQQLNTSINLNEKNSGSYEIVFVKHVKIGGSAYIAGLREGDRPICINNIPLSDKSYSDIISIIEQSGLVLELKVIASSSSSLSSIPFLDQSQLKLNRIAEKPSTFQHYEQSTATRGGTSSPIRRQANFTSDYSTLGLTPNSNLASAEPLTNRTHRNTIGLGSLGMSALFYSFLKNNARGTGSPADSGYESRIDNSGMANRTSSLYQETEKNSPNKSLPLAQLKLKNLQEVIAKSYSKEELSKYGIMVPNVQSPSVAQNKENLNRAQYYNYSNSGSIDNPIDSKFNQKYINYNAPPLSTKGRNFFFNSKASVQFFHSLESQFFSKRKRVLIKHKRKTA